MPYVLISAQIRLVRTSLVNKIASDSTLKSLSRVNHAFFECWPFSTKSLSIKFVLPFRPLDPQCAVTNGQIQS